MKYTLIAIFSLLLTNVSFSQWQESPMASCEDAAFNRKVNKALNYSVDVISVDDLKENYDDYLILDTRELNEYLVSHLPGAEHFGYGQPKWELLESLDTEKDIVVYCSIGYRSEKIGEKLIKRGYKVRNLYGSIFEWANQNYPLEDPRDNPTLHVHTYDKKWSKWVLNPEVKKVF